jgi:dCTP deaminase
MVVSGNHLAQLSARVEGGIIHPWHERTQHNGSTYGQSYAGYDIRIRESLYLKQGEFSLASTIEHFQIPLNMVAIVHDKSSWARRGIAVQNTVFEPGWRGYATLEISNHGHYVQPIFAGDPIAQVIFHFLSEPLVHGYDGKYQDQPPMPVEAIMQSKENR